MNITTTMKSDEIVFQMIALCHQYRLIGGMHGRYKPKSREIDFEQVALQLVTVFRNVE